MYTYIHYKMVSVATEDKFWALFIYSQTGEKEKEISRSSTVLAMKQVVKRW